MKAVSQKENKKKKNEPIGKEESLEQDGPGGGKGWTQKHARAPV